MLDLKKKIATRVASIEASGIRKIFDLGATLKDPVNLSIGLPDFDVPEPVKEAAIAALRAGFNRYTPSGGIPELREKILSVHCAQHGVAPEGLGAVVTAGVSGALTLALMALVEPGDEVLIPDPYFVSYKHLTAVCGGTPVCYDTYPDFKVDPQRVAQQITPRTKLIIAMSPGNPTGELLSGETKRALAEVARAKGVILVSDEIYDLFTYENRTSSLGAFYPEGTLVLGGLSKTAAMTGWRIGWAIGPNVLLEQMLKIQQFTFVCAPSFAQKAALKAFEADLSSAVPAYKGKRDRMYEGLRAMGYELTRPGGAFYLFVKVPPKYASGQAFVEEAIKRNLLLVPGGVFSERDTHFRISYAAPDAKLTQALEIFKGMI